MSRAGSRRPDPVRAARRPWAGCAARRPDGRDGPAARGPVRRHGPAAPDAAEQPGSRQDDRDPEQDGPGGDSAVPRHDPEHGGAHPHLVEGGGLGVDHPGVLDRVGVTLRPDLPLAVDHRDIGHPVDDGEVARCRERRRRAEHHDIADGDVRRRERSSHDDGTGGNSWFHRTGQDLSGTNVVQAQEKNDDDEDDGNSENAPGEHSGRNRSDLLHGADLSGQTSRAVGGSQRVGERPACLRPVPEETAQGGGFDA